jgi:pyrimidine operon attenuation protein / uracil phosphoribosyltransferase
MSQQNVVLDDEELSRALIRIAHEILERNTDPSELAIVGIHSRGAVLARRIVGLLNEFAGVEILDRDRLPSRRCDRGNR